MPNDIAINPDQWFVTNGVVAQGPVEFDRLVREVAHGQIPSGSFVRHSSWKEWRALSEIGDLSSADRLATVHRLAGRSDVADARAADPRSTPPPPLEAMHEMPRIPRDSSPPLSAARPAAVNPVGVLAGARSLEEGLLLALSTAVAASKADLGLLHRSRRELGAVVITYAHGANAETILGTRLAEEDPSMNAALEGRTVIGEPHLGDAGRYIAGRLSACVGSVRGVAMVPVVVFGELVAMIELGRTVGPFRAREIARVEDVVEALAARIVVAGWEPAEE